MLEMPCKTPENTNTKQKNTPSLKKLTVFFKVFSANDFFFHIGLIVSRQASELLNKPVRRLPLFLKALSAGMDIF